MLQAGIDISGNRTEGNCRFMAIVIGTKVSIDNIIKYLEYDPSQSNKTAKIRSIFSSKLTFDGKENIAFCIKIDRDRIVNEITKTKRKKQKRTMKKRIFRTYDYILLNLLRDRLLNFLIKHNYTLAEVVFQCDGDCIDFLKNDGLHHAHKGNS